MPTFTLDQIANQLTGGTPRAFDVTVDRNITVNLSHLSVEARTIALTALNSWTAATGITFTNVSTTPTAFTETVDVAASTATNFNLSTNATVAGNISFDGDTDYYRVTLTAGQTYVIGMSSLSSGSAVDSVLELRDSTGNTVLVTADSPDAAAGEYIIHTATTTGTYYIAADGFEATQGGYELSVQTAADITFSDLDPTGAYAFSETGGPTGQTILRSYINIADNWDVLSMNSYMLQTYIHEIGHALGLSHAGNYNVTAAWPTDALYDNDSWLTTIMSYFDQLTNTTVANDSYALLATIMPADIVAIQNLYGAGPTGHQTGNTIWGPGGNLGNTLQTMLNMWANLIPDDPAIFRDQPIAFTVYDTGGIDTLDFSAFSNTQEIFLTELLYSNVGGLVDNVVIARGTVIENAIGGSGIDTITGNAGANILNGGTDALADTLIGGLGIDTYIINSATDNITELVGGGVGDRAKASVSFILAAGDNIEFLETTNAALLTAINLTGNEIAQTITGSAGANILNGGTDALTDTLIGLGGNDTYVINSINDNITEAAGGGTADRARASVSFILAAGDNIEFLETTNAAGVGLINLTGNEIAQSIIGNAGANILNGGIDAVSDTLTGGLGNDTYIINTSSDLISEFVAGGLADVVKASVSFTLANDDYIETMQTTDAALLTAINLTGNGIRQVITGNAGVNILNGGVDVVADTLAGGLGNDTYIINTSSDLITEFVSGGTADVVQASVSFVLANDDYIEVMQTTNAALLTAINLTGNALTQSITGNAGANILNGAGGNDILTGGLGADSFLFNSTLSAASNRDTITDFNVVADTIQLENTGIFTALGAALGVLDINLFKNLTTGGPLDATDRILYDDTTGAIFYDADGTGATAAIQFATLTGSPTVTNLDFFVV